MKTIITPEGLQAALIKHLPQPWTRATAMHLALAGRYDAKKGLVACTQDALADELKISATTVKVLKRQVAESGYWILTRGRKGEPSTYTPSKRLVSLVRKAAR